VGRKIATGALLVVLAGCGSAKQSPPITPAARAHGDFVGIYSDDAFYGDPAYRRTTFEAERAAGVQLIRQPFSWADFMQHASRYDAFVRAAADAGIRVLPILLGPEPGAPAAAGGMPPPSSPARFAAWAAALVRRYGPHGSLWRGDPRSLPITSWQVWNEPNIPAFWAPQPNPAAYARLLAAADRAIKKADPNAEVVTAGLPTSHLGVPADRFLAGMLAAGAKGAFDTVAVHPYAATPAAVLGRVRTLHRVLASSGDNAKIWVTEFGWGTGGKPGPLTVSPARQAAFIKQTLDRLAAVKQSLGIRGAVVFQWRDPKPFPGRRPIWPYYAGLLDDAGRPKPSLAGFRAAAKRLRAH
jgi:hypothetical protein